MNPLCYTKNLVRADYISEDSESSRAAMCNNSSNKKHRVEWSS